MMEAAVRHNSLIFAGTIVAILGAFSCRADSFSIYGDNVNWQYSPGDTLNYFIGIENSSNSSEYLFNWSLNIYIHPSEEATGGLLIQSAYQPSDNYLLADRSCDFGPPFVGPANYIDIIGDSDIKMEGVQILEDETYYLLELVLQASDDACGLFKIDVQAQDQTAYWSKYDDFFADPPIYREFDNIPFDSDSQFITIGTVEIQTVPEPSSFILFVLLFGFLTSHRLRLFWKS